MNINSITISRVHLTTVAMGVIGILAFFMIVQYVMWFVTALLILVWMYCIVYPRFLDLTNIDIRLAVWFALLILQSVHFSEHVAQMIQIHVYHWQPAISHGIFGAAFDVEWFHFFFDTLWIPINTGFLLLTYRRSSNRWLWILLPIAIWHGLEHIQIMSVYLSTGKIGTPGLLAMGGLIHGGLPIIRADLHFIYNLIEELLIAIGYVAQVKVTDK